MRIPSSSPPEIVPSPSLPLGTGILALLTGIALLVLGGVSLFSDYRLLHKLTHMDESYRPVPAKMLQVRIRRDTTETGDKYHPDVLFEYFIGGKSVWGWRFSYEEEPRPRAYWEVRLAPYHEGDRVTAYVHLSEPKDSFLEKKSDGLTRLRFKAVLAGGFAAAGLILVVLSVTMLFGKSPGTSPQG